MLVKFGDRGCMNTVIEEPSLETASSRRFPNLISEWLAAFWVVGVSAWAMLNFVQLRISTALIELAGLNRGKPIDTYDHFSDLPELDTAIRSATLTVPNLLSWSMVLFLVSITGPAIGSGVERSDSKHSRSIIAVMVVAWLLGVLVGVAHFGTLDLLAWLDN